MFADEKGIIRALIPYFVIACGGWAGYIKHLEERGIDKERLINEEIETFVNELLKQEG